MPLTLTPSWPDSVRLPIARAMNHPPGTVEPAGAHVGDSGWRSAWRRSKGAEGGRGGDRIVWGRDGAMGWLRGCEIMRLDGWVDVGGRRPQDSLSFFGRVLERQGVWSQAYPGDALQWVRGSVVDAADHPHPRPFSHCDGRRES